MNEIQEAFDNNTTTKESDNGHTTVRCNKGFWSVYAPNKQVAIQEARHYFYLYWIDGEYDD